MTTRRQFLSLSAGDGWDDLPDSRRTLNRAAANILAEVAPLLASHFVDAIIGSVLAFQKAPMPLHRNNSSAMLADLAIADGIMPMSPARLALTRTTHGGGSSMGDCWCSGAFYGAPRCNCLMEGSAIRNGRWVASDGKDMGPAPWPDMPYADLGRWIAIHLYGDRLHRGALQGSLEWWGSRYGGDLGRLP